MLSKRRAILCTGAIALAWALPSAAMAESYVLTTSGTITSGTDGLGLFGSAGGNLANANYTLSAMFDPAELNLSTDSSTALLYGSFSQGAAVTVTVTINGKSITDVIASGSADLYADALGNDLEANGGGNTAGGQFVEFYEEVSSFLNSFVSGPNFDPIVYQVDGGDFASTSFDTTSGPIGSFFSGTPNAISLQTVPEPASLALLGLGLAAFVRRKHRT